MQSQEAIAAFQNCRERLRVYTHKVLSQEGIDTSPGTALTPEDALSADKEVNNDRE